ncbi:MAG: PorT family protein [Flavobacterium sp.]|nr:PorT family protein [Candidatus Neoflavobacterium equi]
MNKVLALLTMILSLSANAQGGIFGKDPIINLENIDKKPISWGYYLGVNFYDFKMDYKRDAKDVTVNSTTGFNVGMIGNVRISNHFDVRLEPGVSFTTRNLTFHQVPDVYDQLREVKSTYINIPIIVHYSAKRTGNIKPYLLGGYMHSINLAANEDAKDDNSAQKFRMKSATGSMVAGVGIDLYFEYFKFSPSIRGVFGIDDELVRDNDPNSPWTGNIHKMNTRGVFLNFAFH